MKSKRKTQLAQTEEQKKAIADALSKKIVMMLIDFYRRTGLCVGMVDVRTDGQMVDGHLALQQTVNLQYGMPELRQQPIQIERTA